MFRVPDMPYAYDALEPSISRQIMELHHQRHHAGYVAKLNAYISDHPELAGRSIEELLRDATTNTITEIRRHGGGHYNHSLFWQMMSPQSEMNDTVEQALGAVYGSMAAFREQFTAAALQLFGSGWCWLEADLSISTTHNQDTPLMYGRAAPLLGLDVWEHAYYLDYYNDRRAYIDAWWNVVNWDYVAEWLGNA